MKTAFRTTVSDYPLGMREYETVATADLVVRVPQVIHYRTCCKLSIIFCSNKGRCDLIHVWISDVLPIFHLAL